MSLAQTYMYVYSYVELLYEVMISTSSDFKLHVDQHVYMYEYCIYFVPICIQEILDADDTPLKSHTGQIMARDIVQFVPFRELMRKSASVVGLQFLKDWLRALSFHMYMYMCSAFCNTCNCASCMGMGLEPCKFGLENQAEKYLTITSSYAFKRAPRGNVKCIALPMYTA